MNPDNARILRITAAAGTELADAFSFGTCKRRTTGAFTPEQKKFTNLRSVCLQIFLTAASRRSLVRVSVPVWGTFLSEPLSIVGLVGRYPANCLMERMPIHQRIAPFNKYHHVVPLFHRVLIHLSMACPRLMGRLHTRYSPVRRSPPGHCCPVMPLDLHVLSLPLAFILSQDQTLRCLFLLFYLFL